MQGNGWKLANVLDGAVPGQASVEIGNHAQIDAVHAGFLQHILDNAALTRSGEKDFVDELLARELEERVEGSDDVTAGRYHLRRGIGEFNETFEGVAEVADSLEVMTKSVSFGSGADNEDIAGILAALESTVEQGAVDEAPQAQGNRDQNQRQDNDAPRDVFCAKQIQGSSEQEAGGEADLHGEPLFIQEGVQTGGRVEIQPAAGYDQDGRESEKHREQDPHRTTVEEGSMVKSTCSDDGACVTLVDSGDAGRSEDRDEIDQHPKLDLALGTAGRARS